MVKMKPYRGFYRKLSIIFRCFWNCYQFFFPEIRFLSIFFDKSYMGPHFDHTGPVFDRLDRQKMVFRFYWSNFHIFISREMMIGAKTLFMISFSYIKHVFDHMGPGFDRLDRQKMVFRFYWSKFHEFMSMEIMFGAKATFIEI